MIYFIRSGKSDYVKIGYCSGEPKHRLSRLQIGNPEKLQLLAVAPGERWDEERWHCDFRHLRVRGEWFRWEADLQKAADPFLVPELRELRFRREKAALMMAGMSETDAIYGALFRPKRKKAA